MADEKGNAPGICASEACARCMVAACSNPLEPGWLMCAVHLDHYDLRQNPGLRSNEPQTVCAYCGQAAGHSKRCAVTKLGAGELRAEEARPEACVACGKPQDFRVNGCMWQLCYACDDKRMKEWWEDERTKLLRSAEAHPADVGAAKAREDNYWKGPRTDEAKPDLRTALESLGRYFGHDFRQGEGEHELECSEPSYDHMRHCGFHRCEHPRNPRLAGWIAKVLAGSRPSEATQKCLGCGLTRNLSEEGFCSECARPHRRSPTEPCTCELCTGHPQPQGVAQEVKK